MLAGLAILVLVAAVPLVPVASPAALQPPEVVAVGFVTENGCQEPLRFVFDAVSASGVASREASCGWIFAEDVFTGGGCLEWCTGWCAEHANTTVECWRLGPYEGEDWQPYARLDPDGAFLLRDLDGNILTGQLVRTP